MIAMKKMGITLAFVAGVGAAVISSPTANASEMHAGPSFSHNSQGCFYDNQWHDWCDDNHRDRRDRDRNRDRHNDHDNNHHH